MIWQLGIIPETALEYLRGVVLAAQFFLQDKERIAPDSLFRTLQLLHGILSSFHKPVRIITVFS